MTKCINWKGSKDKDGYGLVNINRRLTRAHREAFRKANGILNPKLMVLHHCDNPSCVNPEHLYQGTHAENMRDRQLRKGFPSGEFHKDAKLMTDHVRTIRKLYKEGATQQSLANKFGISQANVSRIVLRKLWKQV